MTGNINLTQVRPCKPSLVQARGVALTENKWAFVA